MPEFNYVAAGRDGKKIQGKMEASNEGELRMALRGQGLRPIKITKASLVQVDILSYLSDMIGIGGTVPTERVMNFVRQLQVMLTSGVPLVQALELFHDQETHPTMKTVLGTSKEKLKTGNFLWECFSAYPSVFDRVFVALIRAGESSGSLDVMLNRCGKYMENAYKLKKLVKGAMVYPIAVLIIAAGVVTLMMLMVIPKFEEMIVGSGGELPAPTKFVISLSHWFTNNIWFIVIFTAVAGYLFRMFSKSRDGKIVIQRFTIRMPLFGDLIQKSGVAKFSRTMSTLLTSGVPMVDALDICRTASEHISFEDAVSQIKREIELGSQISTAMYKHVIFPRMATQMVTVGESTGNLDKMFEKVADFYEEEVNNTVQNLMKLIEPFMLVFLGGVVGGLMIAMYLPIFQIAGSQVK